MSTGIGNSDRTEFDALPPASMVRVNDICDRFESLCRTQRDVSLPEFFDEHRFGDKSVASALLVELVAIDLHHRLGNDPKLDVDKYLNQYPDLNREDLKRYTGRDAQESNKTANEPLQENTRLGDYQIHERIGQGGMGDVYRASHVLMAREVAVKVLTQRVRDDPLAQRRFEREVRSVARLSHPSIVTAFDARRDSGMLYLVTEWIPGQELSKMVSQDGPLPVSDVVEYMKQTATALQYAHECGVVHRDVKPSNLLLDQHGNIKILDLGLAKLLLEVEDDSAEPDAITQSDHLLGTAAFLSPEQARSPFDADAQSDIYSLGCTLYFLLAGQPPYKGKTAVDTILAHVEQTTPNLRNANVRVPERLATLTRKMMDVVPGGRPASMNAVAEELNRVSLETKRDRRVWPVLIACLMVVAVFGSWLASTRQSTEVVATNRSTDADPNNDAVPNEDASPNSVRVILPNSALPGLTFNGTTSYAEVTSFDTLCDASIMIEAHVTPKLGKMPSTVVGWSGPDSIYLFVNQTQNWGVARRLHGAVEVLFAEPRIELGRPYLLAGRSVDNDLALYVDGQPVPTRSVTYPMEETETGFFIGGMRPGILPLRKSERFFSGTIHAVRASKGALPDVPKSPQELRTTDTSTVVVYAFDKGQVNNLNGAGPALKLVDATISK